MPVTAYSCAATAEWTTTSSSAANPATHVIPRSSQPDRTPLEFNVAPRQLCDFRELIHREAGKMLARVAGRPPELQVYDSRRSAQADVLFQWRSPEGAATADRAVDRPCSMALVFNRDFDPGADCRPVGLHAHEPHVDPIIPVAGIF